MNQLLPLIRIRLAQNRWETLAATVVVNIQCPKVHLFVNNSHTSHSDPTLFLSKIGHKQHTGAHKQTHTLLLHPSAQPHLAHCCLWVGSGCWEPRVSRSAPDRWQHLQFSSSKSFKLGEKRVIWPRRGEGFPCACLLLLRQFTKLPSW